MRSILEFILPNTGFSRSLWTTRLKRHAFISNKAQLLGWPKLGDKTYIDDDVLIDATFGSVVVGAKCRIFKGVVLDTRGGSIAIGDDTWVEPYSVIFGQGGVVIGTNSSLSPGVKVVAFNHKWPTVGLKETREGITIGDDCWIGSSATILDGVKVGSGSVVGAGAVVTHDVPPRALAVGNPARVVRQL